MKPIDIDPIIKAIEARQENAEDLPPLTTGDFLRMLREASEPETLTNLDRIRALTTEELAEFLKGYDADDAGIDFCSETGECPHAKECHELESRSGCYYVSERPVTESQRMMWLDWLKMEWKGGQDE